MKRLPTPNIYTPIETSARYLTGKLKKPISIVIMIDPETGKVDSASWRRFKKKDGDRYAELHGILYTNTVDTVNWLLRQLGYKKDEPTDEKERL